MNENLKVAFICPHCNRPITEADLKKENATYALHLREFFSKKEEEYKKEFSENLMKQLKEQYQVQINALTQKFEQEKDKLVSQKELELQKTKQVELDELKNQIKDQDIKLKNTETEIEKLLTQKELEVEKNKQNEINHLKQLLSQQEIQLNNIKGELKSALVEKELEIEKAKQSEIDELKNQIKDQAIKLKSTELEIEKLLTQKELEVEKNKQNEIDQIKQILNDKELKLQEQVSLTEILITQKQLELRDANQIAINNLRANHEQEKLLLQENIKTLELANAKSKIIQSKAKGENFEHEVEKILRDSFEPEDIIKKITTGEKKADYLQIIRDGENQIGKIVYEVKNAEWKDNWEKKLIEDMARENSKYGILIATSLNDKYPGIAFKRSDLNPNIYLVDSESFVFIGQLVKSLIKTELRIEERYKGKNLEEKLDEFKKWRETQIPSIHKTIQDSLDRIEKAETAITKQINEIRIGREKLYSQWIYKVKEFIENIIL